MASREAARVSIWERVPWCSKSFSPRRGRVGWPVVLEGRQLDVWGKARGKVMEVLLGESGEEAEVLGFVGEIGVCGVWGCSDRRIFVDVGHGYEGGNNCSSGLTVQRA